MFPEPMLETPGNTEASFSFPRFHPFPEWRLETESPTGQEVTECFRVSSGQWGVTMDLQAIFGGKVAPPVVPVVTSAAVSAARGHPATDFPEAPADAIPEPAVAVLDAARSQPPARMLIGFKPRTPAAG